MYQFILDKTQFLTDQPKGWQEIKRKVKRDSLTKSLIISYTSKLTFVGDGYTYLLGRIESEGLCGTSTIEIIDQQNNIEVFGNIRYADAVIDITNCTIEAVVEDDNYYAEIQRLRNYKVNVNNTTTLDGSAIADIGVSCPAVINNYGVLTNDGTTIYDLTPQAFTFTPGGSPSLTLWNWNTYPVYDTFEYILNVLTNNNITFQSDFFDPNNTYTVAIKKVEVSGSISIGDTISWSFTNRWGVVYSGSLLTTSTIISFNVLALIYEMSMGSSSYEAILDYADYKADGPMAAWPNYPTLDEFFIQYPFDFDDFTISSTNGGTIFTVTNISSRNYQAGQLTLVTGRDLVYHDTTEPNLTLSFNDLFTNLDKFFNLTAYFYKDNTGAQFCRIEPSSYFFNDANTVAMDNVQAASFKHISDWGWKNYNYGTAYGDTSFGLQTNASYTSDSCSDEDADGNSEFIVEAFNLSSFRFQENMEEKQIQLLSQSAGDIYGFLMTSKFSTPEIDRAWASALECNHMEAANAWGFWGVNNAIYTGNRVLEVDRQIIVNKEWTLKGSLTCSEVDDLVADPFARIQFTHFGTSYEGYVGEVEQNIYTGETTLKLLTE